MPWKQPHLRDRRSPARGRPAPSAPKPQGSYLEGAIQDFLISKRAKGQSPSTIELTTYSLGKLWLPFCLERGIKAWDQVDQRLLDRFRAHLLHDGRRRREDTVNTYCQQVNTFLRWLHKQGEIHEAPRAHTTPWSARTDPALTDEELKRILGIAQHGRDRLIIETLVSTGIRVDELCTLRYDRLDRTRDLQFIRVLEKGGRGVRERQVPLIMPGAMRQLERYIQSTGGRSPDQPYVFLSKRRHPHTGEQEPIRPPAVRKLLRDLAIMAGIERRVYPHLLRATFITRALRKGIPEVTIARVVGHRDLRMIHRHYDRTTDDDSFRMLQKALAEDLR